MDKKHHIVANLSGIQFAVSYTKDKKDCNYYLLILDYDKNKITIRDFNNIELATKCYGEIEKVANVNVVLVSANSFDTVREAYPNYFADISEFINFLKEIFDSCFVSTQFSLGLGRCKTVFCSVGRQMPNMLISLLVLFFRLGKSHCLFIEQSTV